ncbi:MAG TPA: hypothetical protein PLW81_06905 [Thiobacillaceae bacterium]|nr:hypothetical protein [Thiobacillaceae bacterium]
MRASRHIFQYICRLLCLALMVKALTAYAASRELYYLGSVTESEYLQLPTYCRKFELENGAFIYDNFVASLTPEERAITLNSGGFHHYCRIPLGWMRYYSSKEKDKKGYYIQYFILNEADYMLRGSSQDAPLRPYFHIEKARALVTMKHEERAIAEYLMASRLDPHIPTPYLDMARIHVRLNNKQKALELITEGLKYNPDSEALRKRYVEFGGQMPYPTPYPAKGAQAQQPAEQEKPKDVVPSERPTATPEIATKGRHGSDKPVQQDNTPKGSTNKLSDNPFCRFCPVP